MEPSKPPPTCPICQRPLAAEPTTTLVDIEPYRLRREPPVSVRVHRACAARTAPVATDTPAAEVFA